MVKRAMITGGNEVIKDGLGSTILPRNLNWKVWRSYEGFVGQKDFCLGVIWFSEGFGCVGVKFCL